MPITIERRF